MNKNIEAPKINFDGGYVQVIMPKFPFKNIWMDILYLEKGRDLPEHRHFDVSSFLICNEGEGTLILDGKKNLLKAGVCAHIPENSKHHIIASDSHSLKCLAVNEGIINIDKSEKTVDLDFTDNNLKNKWLSFFNKCGDVAKQFSSELKDKENIILTL